jgi:hypothetical protein
MANKQEIFVVVQQGIVREVVGLPANTQVTVLDYDIEGADLTEIKISPVDGEACLINQFQYESFNH